MAKSLMAKAILDGTYNYTSEVDPATCELLQECARIRLRVPANCVDTDVNRYQWQKCWAKAKEKTSSSQSGQILDTIKRDHPLS